MTTRAAITLIVFICLCQLPARAASIIVGPPLSPPPGRAHGINKQNQIVGTSAGDENATGFVFLNGSITVLSAPNSTQTLATAVENNGRVVGAFDDSKGRHGFLFFHGTYTTLDVPNATQTVALGINDPQTIVGFYIDPQRTRHGFLFDGKTYTTIDAPAGVGAVATEATAINNPGDIVGVYVTQDGHKHGFLLDKSGNFSTIDVPNALDTLPSGINSPGLIVGAYIDDAGTHGFLNSSGTFASTDAPDTPAAIGTIVTAINDNDSVIISGSTVLTGTAAP